MGAQTVRRIISKGLIQTRGGWNGNAKALHVSPLPFADSCPACCKTSCKSLSKTSHLRDLLDKVVRVQHAL